MLLHPLTILLQVQGPYCSISAFDRGDDYDEYAVCVAYVFVHPHGKELTSNGRVFTSGTIIKVAAGWVGRWVAGWLAGWLVGRRW